MRYLILAPLFTLLLANPIARPREPVVGLPCEGCEAVFQGMPANLYARSRIAPVSEPGQPMTVSGFVYGRDRRPRSNVIVYAYQTNAGGIYPTSQRSKGRASHRHGLLRGWALTGLDGGYQFETIRPAGYPGTDLPAHIHMHVIERGCATYYIDDIMFTDDPRLTSGKIRKLTLNRAGRGVVTPTRVAGRWLVRRDIRLGLNISGYPDCR